jgi:HEAT repeat protein
MGLFDFFKGSKEKQGDNAKPVSPAAKWADRAADKRAQSYDRQEAIQALAQMATADAATALLRRFTFVTDPTITDEEEKQAAFEGILRAGKDAIEPIRAFAATAQGVVVPIRLMKELLDQDAYIAELVAWLSKWDTEYAKFSDPKVQLLDALASEKHPLIAKAVTPFLDDVDDAARYSAVAALFAQEDPEVVPKLVRLLAREESFRIKNKIADGLASKGWEVPQELQDEVARALSSQYMLEAATVRAR